jgi:hypothetical protein
MLANTLNTHTHTHNVVPSDTWAVRTSAQQSLAACGHSMKVKCIQYKNKVRSHTQYAMKKSHQSSVQKIQH